MTQSDAPGDSGGTTFSFSDFPFQTHDLSSMKTLLDQISASATAASKSLTNGFSGAIASGKSFNDTLATISQSLAKIALRTGTQALAQGLASGIGALFSQAFGGGSAPVVAPFAEGGIVASPTFFNSSGSVGLMGERGAEAIMPLARGPDGQLGVKMQGQKSAVSVTVNVAAQDAESFLRSEGQIAAALARAVARGQRNL